MNKFLNLTSLTFEGDDAELDKTIDDVQTQIEKYSQSVDDIKSKNIETFWQIQSTLHPLPSARAATRQVQASPQVPMPVGFKPNSDLKPALLVKDCI